MPGSNLGLVKMKGQLGIAVVLVTAMGGATMAADFGGRYTVTGTNLDGTSYSGTADIKITSNTTCEITWVTGSTTSVGHCMGMGDIIAASYSQGKNVGLAMYQQNADGSLDGYWTVAGRDGSGTETLTPE